MMAAFNAAARSPQTSTSASFDRYLEGPAQAALDSKFATVKSHDLGERGTSSALRITLTSMRSVGGTKFAVLTNCPLISPTDPVTSYYIKTGKPYVVTPDPDAAPQPWPETFNLFQANSVGPWKITLIASDSTKTCHG